MHIQPPHYMWDMILAWWHHGLWTYSASLSAHMAGTLQVQHRSPRFQHSSCVTGKTLAGFLKVGSKDLTTNLKKKKNNNNFQGCWLTLSSLCLIINCCGSLEVNCSLYSYKVKNSGWRSRLNGNSVNRYIPTMTYVDDLSVTSIEIKKENPHFMAFRLLHFSENKTGWPLDISRLWCHKVTNSSVRPVTTRRAPRYNISFI